LFSSIAWSQIRVESDTTALPGLIDKYRSGPDDPALFDAVKMLLPRYPAPGSDDEYFVFEGDILLNEIQLKRALRTSGRSPQPAPTTAQRPELVGDVRDGAFNFWRTAKERHLTYAIDRNSFGHLSDSQANYEEIREEFAVATRAWVEICPECGITFQHLTQNDNTSSPGRQTFIIRQVSSGQFLAHSFFPHDVINKRYVDIDTSLSHETRLMSIAVLTHEIGHILGYRHEHLRNKDLHDVGVCVWQDETWKPITESYDPCSVMHYHCHHLGPTIPQLTRLDIAAHRSLYLNGPQPQPIPGDACKPARLERAQSLINLPSAEDFDRRSVSLRYENHLPSAQP
jgi:hypothetical protein